MVTGGVRRRLPRTTRAARRRRMERNGTAIPVWSVRRRSQRRGPQLVFGRDERRRPPAVTRTLPPDVDGRQGQRPRRSAEGHEGGSSPASRRRAEPPRDVPRSSPRRPASAGSSVKDKEVMQRRPTICNPRRPDASGTITGAFASRLPKPPSLKTPVSPWRAERGSVAQASEGEPPMSRCHADRKSVV